MLITPEQRQRLGEKFAQQFSLLRRRLNGQEVHTLYCVSNRGHDLMFLVVARTSEHALDLIREAGLEDWELANTTTRKVQANVDSDARIIDAFEIGKNRDFRVRLTTSNQSRKRKAKRPGGIAPHPGRLGRDR